MVVLLADAHEAALKEALVAAAAAATAAEGRSRRRRRVPGVSGVTAQRRAVDAEAESGRRGSRETSHESWTVLSLEAFATQLRRHVALAVGPDEAAAERDARVLVLVVVECGPHRGWSVSLQAFVHARVRSI